MVCDTFQTAHEDARVSGPPPEGAILEPDRCLAASGQNHVVVARLLDAVDSYKRRSRRSSIVLAGEARTRRPSVGCLNGVPDAKLVRRDPLRRMRDAQGTYFVLLVISEGRGCARRRRTSRSWSRGRVSGVRIIGRMCITGSGAAVVVFLLLTLGCSGDEDRDSMRTQQTQARAHQTGPDLCRTRACRRTWSRKVATSAGYEIVKFTGSAWVARNENRSFYIWATSPVAATRLIAEGSRVVRRVGGVPIYDDGIRLAWRASGATVWIQSGPLKHSVAPKPSEVDALVEASTTVRMG